MSYSIRLLLLAGLIIVSLLASAGPAHAQSNICGRCNDALTPWTYGTGVMTTTGTPSCTIEYTFRYRVTICGTQDVNILGYQLVHPNHSCLGRTFNPSVDMAQIRAGLLRNNPMAFLPSAGDSGCYTIGFFGQSCFQYIPTILKDTISQDSITCRDSIVISYTIDSVSHDTIVQRDTVVYCDTLHLQHIDVDTTIIYLPCSTSGCCGVVYRVCSDGHGHIIATTASLTFPTGDTCSAPCKLACPTSSDTLILQQAGRSDPPKISSTAPQPGLDQGSGRKPLHHPAEYAAEALLPAAGRDPQH